MKEEKFIEMCHGMLNPPKPIAAPRTDAEKAAWHRQALKQMENSAEYVYYVAIDKNSPDRWADTTEAAEFLSTIRCNRSFIVPIAIE